MSHHMIEKAVQILRESQQVVALTGAGISRPSGIPDYRSSGGLWGQVDPMEVASLQTFEVDPWSFYEWFQPLIEQFQEAQPNPAHLALARMERWGLLSAIVTQNIDGLHQLAGSREVYELHGHLRSATCMVCERKVDFKRLMRDVRYSRTPLCSCGGTFKPDIVLFDEPLPRGLFWLAHYAIEQCDALLIVGTSLEVYPVSEMPQLAMRSGARTIIVNLSETHIDSQADVVIREDVAFVLPEIAKQLATHCDQTFV